MPTPIHSFCSLGLLVFCATLSASEIVEHAGTSYHTYRFDPPTETLELHSSPAPGKPNRFPELAARIAAEGRLLKFAMNAGIFEGNFLPSGLHVSEGKTVVPLNTDEFVKEREGQLTPNFFLKPNGVFYLLASGEAGILETSEYQSRNLRPLLATQSGPLLLRNNRIHPILTKDSTSARYRNGVGITKDGAIVFACSVLDRDRGMSNLYRFAELFRETLGCENALYLDGDISYAYIRGVTGEIEDRNFFGGILAVTEKEP